MSLRRISVLAALAVISLAGPAAAEPPAECGLEDPAIAAAAAPVPHREGDTQQRRGFSRPIVRAQAHSIGVGAAGSLSGKVVYLSPGHGFTYLPQLSGWRTQRGNTHGLVEDLISVETVSTYLARYLRLMGATVVGVRELDTNAERVIVDEIDFDFAGSSGLVARSVIGGYGHLVEPITGNQNPFAAGNHLVLDAEAASDSPPEVRWALDVPSTGEYSVYVGYVADASRATDAHYVVRHVGGETHLRVDQTRRGGTWLFLGRFAFDEGLSPERGAVALLVDSQTPGATLSADVVRIGGGVGAFERGGGPSGRPMFEHAARYYTQWAGAPESVYGYLGLGADADRSGDVGARSRFAAWDHEDGEDAVYVAWHTNAPSPARGTSSYAYADVASGTVDDFSGVPGSLELMDAIHGQLLGDLRAEWDADWQDRGQRTAFFGEVNPDHNPEMPATLLEIAFHDTEADADALRDPRFRRIAARAIARGVARYFGDRDGNAVTLPPEPPTALVMASRGADVRLEWQAVEGATSYVVYLSPDGRGFGPGVVVADNSLDIDMGERDESVVFARVAAANLGGQSLPSNVVGAHTGGASVLVVAGFDRLDSAMLIDDDLSAFDIDIIERGLIDRINDGSHVSRYGNALAAYRASFDTATTAAVIAGDVRLADYEAVLWFVGEEAPGNDPLDASERALVGDYLAGGGQVLLSGTELALALDSVMAPELGPFFGATFGAGFVADDAGTYELTGVGDWADLGVLRFDDNGPGGYDADAADVLGLVAADARSLLEYGGGAGPAAVHAPSLGVITMGFPFETVAGGADRDRLMAAVMTTFAIEPEVGGCGCDTTTSPRDALPWGLLALFALALARFRVRCSKPPSP